MQDVRRAAPDWMVDRDPIQPSLVAYVLQESSTKLQRIKTCVLAFHG
jgi:hypothetical protein